MERTPLAFPSLPASVCTSLCYPIERTSTYARSDVLELVVVNGCQSATWLISSSGGARATCRGVSASTGSRLPHPAVWRRQQKGRCPDAHLSASRARRNARDAWPDRRKPTAASQVYSRGPSSRMTYVRGARRSNVT
jgi:hypothetical protein